MIQPVAWSHSRISTFKKCPKQMYETAIAKSVPFEQSPAMLEGDRVHKMLDARVSKKVPFPHGYTYLEPIARVVDTVPGQTFTEMRMTLSPNLTPTGYFAPDAYVRVIIDVAKVRDHEAWLGDYKTGKVTMDQEQLKLFSAVAFHHWPDVTKIRASYIYINHKVIDGADYTREDLPRMWEELLEEPARLQECAASNNWPARPGRHCRWCTVNKYGKCSSAGEPYKGD